NGEAKTGRKRAATLSILILQGTSLKNPAPQTQPEMTDTFNPHFTRNLSEILVKLTSFHFLQLFQSSFYKEPL
ncbi:MAG: hypothetical protein ACXQT1_04870, partial [Methermicoccaceae archaeon]